LSSRPPNQARYSSQLSNRNRRSHAPRCSAFLLLRQTLPEWVRLAKRDMPSGHTFSCFSFVANPQLSRNRFSCHLATRLSWPSKGGSIYATKPLSSAFIRLPLWRLFTDPRPYVFYRRGKIPRCAIIEGEETWINQVIPSV
jgi:hypothetical protein